MQKSQKGFALNTVLLIILVLAVVGFGGYYVYTQNNNKDTTNTAVESSDVKSDDADTDSQEPSENRYSFEAFGLTMNILDGWSVAESHGSEEYGKTYRWEVTKPGADGKIVFSSNGFLGGWGPDCSEDGGLLSAIEVKDVATTQNSELILLSWQESSDTSPDMYIATVIADGSNKHYSVGNTPESPEIADRELKPGTYYRCDSGPNPGWFLGLVKDPVTNAARNDTISAYAVDPSVAYDKGLSTAAASYPEIRSMLTSIK